MNFSEESDIELIERYLKNELTSEERSEFLNRVKGDPEFAEKTDDYGLIIRGMEKQGLTGFQEDLAMWENEIKKKESNTKEIPVAQLHKKQVTIRLEDNWSKYFSMAAAVTIAIVGSIFLIDYKKDKKLNELFAAHFSPYDKQLSPNENKPHVTLAEALESYNSENYEEAISRFERYLDENPHDHQAWFYLGVSQLAAGKDANAVTSFNVVIEKNVNLRNSAEWYKALALIKLNKAQSARKLLREIAASEGHDYQAKAEALLRDL